jgi:hypothetical protein
MAGCVVPCRGGLLLVSQPARKKWLTSGIKTITYDWEKEKIMAEINVGDLIDIRVDRDSIIDDYINRHGLNYTPRSTERNLIHIGYNLAVSQFHELIQKKLISKMNQMNEANEAGETYTAPLCGPDPESLPTAVETLEKEMEILEKEGGDEK